MATTCRLNILSTLQRFLIWLTHFLLVFLPNFLRALRSKKLVPILTLIFFGHTSFCHSFIITEIYANSPGSRNDAGKEWIELTNLAEISVPVKQLDLTIYQSSSTPVFFQRLHFSAPLEFSNTLLIAQQVNLGLSRPLNPEFTQIVMTELSLANSGEQKICVKLNDLSETCSIISKKVKRLDGVALFREISDHGNHPIWKAEPCHLEHAVFATPGLPARACVEHPNLGEIIFAKSTTTTPELDNTPLVEKMLPINGVLQLSDLTKNILDHRLLLSFQSNNDHGEPIILTLCESPRDNICQQVAQPFVVKSSIENIYPLPSVLLRHNLSMQFRDFFGKSIQFLFELPATLRTQTINDPSRSAIKFSWLSENRLDLQVNLTEEDLPLNFQFFDKSNRLLRELALVNKSTTSTIIYIDESETFHHVKYFGPSTRKEIFLSP